MLLAKENLQFAIIVAEVCEIVKVLSFVNYIIILIQFC